VKLKLKVPPLLTTGDPTDAPLKLTSTISVGLKPEPLAVIDAPASPDCVDSVRAAAGVVVAEVVGATVGVPVVA
jgi:hypothetical protein